MLVLRRHLIFSALVIGAISPDLHYFVAFAPVDKTSHTIPGAFYFCLPAALLVFYLFHSLLKLPLISLAPEWHQARLVRFAAPFRFGPTKKFGLIIVSLLTGIFTHLLWDSFTHGRGWMVHHIPALRTVPLAQIGIYRPAHTLLQHVSTLFGLALLTGAYAHWSQTVEPQPVPDNLRLSARMKATVIASVAGTAAIPAVWHAFELPRHTHVSAFVTYATISFTALAFLGLLAFSLYWHCEVRSTSPG